MAANRRRGWNLTAKGLLLVTVPLLFEFAFAGAVSVGDSVSRRDQQAELRSKEITAAAHRVMTLLVDAETGIRGYIITGEPHFTEPYDRAIRELPDALRRLRDLSPLDLQDELDDVERAARPLLAYETLQHDRVATGRRDVAASVVAEGLGKELMDRTRAAMDRFLVQQRENDAIAARMSSNTRNTVRNVLLAGLCANVAAAAVVAWVFSAGIVRRLEVVVDNTRRLEDERPLAARDEGSDEIGDLDARFHDMAAALRQSRLALETANDELEAFSYSVSHDLRAPLRAINGFAQILEEDFGEVLNADGRRVLGTIRSEARRMGQLIDDLLMFSRAGRDELQFVDVDMTRLAREVVRELDAPATFVIGELPHARGDRSTLRQVFVNLLTNAAKFSARNPAAEVHVSGRAEGAENVYSVRDNGAGFDMRYAGKLFGVFQRLHAANEFPGTGVGLAIVKRVVTRHGGRVWAEGKEGEGATFYFTLRPWEAR